MIEFFPGTIRPESSFSKTFLERGKNPKRRGAFFEGDAHGRTLVIATFKTVKLYCLVDFQSNRVYDTRFFSYGDSLSVVISDGIAELIIGKSIEECSKVTVKEVQKL